MVPGDLRYTKDHEWVRVDGDQATIGITEYATTQLGDIVFVELPDVGRALSQSAVFGVVESVKAVSDLFAPISGAVTEANAAAWASSRPTSGSSTKTMSPSWSAAYPVIPTVARSPSRRTHS